MNLSQNIISPGSQTAVLIVAIVLTVFFFILLWQIIKLHQFTKGKNGKSLEEKINNIIVENERISNENKELKNLIIKILQENKSFIKSISTVKFNPFNETGHGKQSFASAMLNKNGEGILISTLSIRGETHIFLKEIINFGKNINLSEEEKRALEKAKEKL